jgi:hypothetical protein
MHIFYEIYIKINNYGSYIKYKIKKKFKFLTLNFTKDLT